MRLTKKMLKDFDYASWEKWVQSRKEYHFFFLCGIHIGFLMRKQDSSSVYQGKKFPVCYYPGCKAEGDMEYFPNLMTTIKRAEKDIKDGKRI